ncbi:FixH family protein [Undibacterium fentianense]|uniref:FixH family protein n=1 Tax=Undibacterium fentianense TaxID=2828728 RepID=A0A941E0M2_9BURK|nr:FixH family protein [Undibacterium fentianense]MBR7798852.1 FixH family protein [Undibacterium fentianense]
MNSGILTQPIKKDSWFKEPWLLLVVGGPLLVVCASLFTGLIAFRGADQVVAKDYYRQGLMINTNLQRDAKARELALNASLQLDLSNNKILMSVKSNQALPQEVQISLASSGALEGGVEEVVRRLPMKLVGAGTYEANLLQDPKFEKALNQSKIQILHVKLETNEWRLTGDWHNPLEKKLSISPLN